LLSNLRGLGYLGARVGAIIMNLVLISLTGVYVNALVMSRAIDSHPIPIAMIVLVSPVQMAFHQIMILTMARSSPWPSSISWQHSSSTSEK
jgi:hypothetical protein